MSHPGNAWWCESSGFNHQTHLTIAFILVSLAPLFILGSVQVSQISKNTREINDVQMQMTQRLADEIETYVDHHRNAIESLAAGLTSSGERDTVELTYYIRSVQQNFPGFLNVYVADKRGITIAFYPATDATGKSLIGYDFSDRDYYKQVSTQGATVVSSLFKGRGGTSKPLITIAAPIFNKAAEFDGYVLGALDLSMVEKFVAKYVYSGQGHAVVVDNANKAIYHPDADIRHAIADLSMEPIVRQQSETGRGLGHLFSRNTALKAKVKFFNGL